MTPLVCTLVKERHLEGPRTLPPPPPPHSFTCKTTVPARPSPHPKISIFTTPAEVVTSSSGASGGCLHGGASFKQKKKEAHFAARKKGPENRKNEVKLRPPLCRPLNHPKNLFGLFLTFRVIFPFCKVILGDPPKIPFKTSTKLTSLGLTLTFCLARQKVKNNPKRFLGHSSMTSEGREWVVVGSVVVEFGVFGVPRCSVQRS